MRRKMQTRYILVVPYLICICNYLYLGIYIPIEKSITIIDFNEKSITIIDFNEKSIHLTK